MNETQALLARVRAGDRDAFALVYDKYAPLVYAICGRRAGVDLAPDLTQEVFAQVYRSIVRKPAPERFEAWITTVTYNVVNSFWRARYAPSRPRLEYVDEVPVLSTPDPSAQRVATMGARALFDRAAELLEVPKRRALPLYLEVLAERLSTEAMAEALGIRWANFPMFRKRLHGALGDALIAVAFIDDPGSPSARCDRLREIAKIPPSPRLRKKITEHIAEECGSCRERRRGMAALISGFASAFPVEHPPADLRDRVLNAVGERRSRAGVVAAAMAISAVVTIVFPGLTSEGAPGATDTGSTAVPWTSPTGVEPPRTAEAIDPGGTAPDQRTDPRGSRSSTGTTSDQPVPTSAVPTSAGTTAHPAPPSIPVVPSSSPQVQAPQQPVQPVPPGPPPPAPVAPPAPPKHSLVVSLTSNSYFGSAVDVLVDGVPAGSCPKNATCEFPISSGAAVVLDPTDYVYTWGSPLCPGGNDVHANCTFVATGDIGFTLWVMVDPG